jgi:hypothetical protein
LVGAGIRGSAKPWLLALLAVAAGMGSWWYLVPDSMPGPIRALLPASPQANPVLYKWRDAKGGLHITDEPPLDRPYETLKYNPKTNVVPSVVPPPGTHP